MAWVPVVDEARAEGPLKEIYQRAHKNFGFVPDSVRVLSLRPEVASAVEQIRKVLLGDASSLGRRRSDLIALAISGLNHCQYCATAHSGMLVQRGDLALTEAVRVYRDWRGVELPEAEKSMLAFAEKLTFNPYLMEEADIAALHEAGFSDVNVYDIVLLTAYRNFINRVHDGLGASTDRLRGRFGDEVVDAIASA